MPLPPEFIFGEAKGHTTSLPPIFKRETASAKRQQRHSSLKTPDKPDPVPQILCWRAFASSDISRWGHFQHADESAYYEFMCKEAGIHVLYCAEQFENDGSFVSARNAALTHQATCRIDVRIEAMRRIWSIVLSRRMRAKSGSPARHVSQVLRERRSIGFGLQWHPTVGAENKAVTPALLVLPG